MATIINLKLSDKENQILAIICKRKMITKRSYVRLAVTNAIELDILKPNKHADIKIGMA